MTTTHTTQAAQLRAGDAINRGDGRDLLRAGWTLMLFVGRFAFLFV